MNRRVVESLIKCGAFDFTEAYRSQMLTVLEHLIERSQLTQKKRGESQLAMWMGPAGEPEERYPEIDEFPEKQLISFEKETIGFYISRHPLTSYEKEIKKITSDDTSTLSKHQNGDEVKICGLVSQLKEIVTKKGERMAFLSLEDMNGFVEVILFPEVFKNALPLLRGGDPMVVRGTLDLSEEHVKVKAIEIRTLSEPGASVMKDLHLKIPLARLTPSQLRDLKGIIVGNKGLTKVLLHLIDGEERETVIALSDQYAVEPSQEFQDHIKDLLPSPVISLE